VSGSFTIGAIAASSRDANSVGAVRITLLPKRLEIELLKAGAYSDGYLPGGLTRFVRVSAPYTAVRGFVRRGQGVLLSFDSRVVTPHNRFYLTHFSDAPLEALAAAYKRRRVAGVLSWLIPLPFAIWASVAVPPHLVAGPLGRIAFGAITLLALGAAGRGLVLWATRGGPLSERLRETLSQRLSQRLGFDPALFHETDPFDVPERDVLVRAGLGELAAPPTERAADALVQTNAASAPPVASGFPGASAPGKPLGFPEPPTLLAPVLPAPAATSVAPPAPTLAPPASVRAPALREVATSRSPALVRTGLIAAAMIVLTCAAGIFSLRLIRQVQPELKPPVQARAGLEDVPIPSDEAIEAPTLPTCRCERADSPLWRGGVPLLSVVPIAKEPNKEGGSSSIAPQLSKRGRGRYNFDLAIVNNAKVPLSDLRVVVTFARRNARNERVGATDRGLFWGGELAPGHSVKWSVKGPGTELKIDVEERRTLGEIGPAPADAFAKLLRSDKLPLRLHAATMLAYLNDPRGVEYARGLTDLGPVDELIRTRILRTAEPLTVCQIKSQQAALSVCAYNGTDEKLWGLSLVEVDGDRRIPIPEPIPKKLGLVIEAPDFGEAPDELSLVRAR
jgi:hypothetical protein